MLRGHDHGADASPEVWPFLTILSQGKAEAHKEAVLENEVCSQAVGFIGRKRSWRKEMYKSPVDTVEWTKRKRTFSAFIQQYESQLTEPIPSLESSHQLLDLKHSSIHLNPCPFCAVLHVSHFHPSVHRVVAFPPL